MEQIDYSVIIRTTGNAHEKYQALLDSIAGLVPKPQEVIVVLPEGYDEPAEKLGWEAYYYSPKGMVIQRMTGIARCKTRYALICDDDVRFDADFAAQLYAPVREGIGSLSAAPLYSFLPEKGPRAWLCILMASAVPTVFHKQDRYVSVLKSSGYSYNRHLKPGRYYEAQSVAWTCFFADIQALRGIAFEEEAWLDAHGYSALDDQTMFYKAWLRGYKTIIVSDARYDHLDAKTSTRNNKPAVLYSGAFNKVVFWHRFIYSMEETSVGRLASCAAFRYRLLWDMLWNHISILRHKMTADDLAVVKQGYNDGWAYLKSHEYCDLPLVCKEAK